MLNLNSILVFSEDPKKLADFYGKVLQKTPDFEDGEYYGFSAGSTFLMLGPHQKVKGKSSNPERLMINFATDDVKAEFARIGKLGAETIAEPYQMEGSSGWIATFADPDGNYFQLMTPWEGENS